MTRTARTGATQLVSDVRLPADYLTPRPDEVNLSELAVPIKIDGVVHAVLTSSRSGGERLHTRRRGARRDPSPHTSPRRWRGSGRSRG
jgi:hypothetical protein